MLHIAGVKRDKGQRSWWQHSDTATVFETGLRTAFASACTHAIGYTVSFNCASTARQRSLESILQERAVQGNLSRILRLFCIVKRQDSAMPPRTSARKAAAAATQAEGGVENKKSIEVNGCLIARLQLHCLPLQGPVCGALTRPVPAQAPAAASPAKKAAKPTAKPAAKKEKAAAEPAAKKGALAVGDHLPDFSVESDTSTDDKKVLQASKVGIQSIPGASVHVTGARIYTRHTDASVQICAMSVDRSLTSGWWPMLAHAPLSAHDVEPQASPSCL